MMNIRFLILAILYPILSFANNTNSNTLPTSDETSTTIKEGYYFIVSAGNGPGYSGGPYNYENKVAMYNKDGIVSWELFDNTNPKFAYHFTPGAAVGTWFVKNVKDNTYIGSNQNTGSSYNGGLYMGNVETTKSATYSQVFTEMTPGKYFITWSGNKYAYSMASSHNGSSDDSGSLTMWGSISSAEKYGVNVWYLQSVPDSLLTDIPDDEKDTIIYVEGGGLAGIPISADPASDNNTAIKVFDNNLSTNYQSSSPDAGWVGMDLGEKHVINKVGYAPTKDNGSKMLLGVFEGANTEDFSDAIPFNIIKEAPENGKLTYADVNCSRGFRYVRYVGPQYTSKGSDKYTYCNIAELRFYGEKGEGNDSTLYQFTNLPLLTFHTYDKLADIPYNQKNIYRQGIFNIIAEDGSYYKTDTMQIKGRGNGSWSLVGSDKAKRPYKFKLNSKKKLLHSDAKAKKWVLIANWGDKTMLRNNVAFKVSEIFKMDYTPSIKLVDVVYNGQYKGSYQLCDQIEVHKNRVEVTEMDSDDNAGDSVTGGYLIELDYYAGSEPKNFRSSTYNIPVTVHYPEDDKITDQQFSYIQSAFNKLCSTVASNNYKDLENGYQSLVDTESWLKYFLIEEFCGNPDAYFSMYLTKDRGYNSKFRVSPVWDFDLAFDNDRRFHSIINNDYLCYSSSTYAAGSLKNMNQRIVASNKEYLTLLWSWYRYMEGLDYENLHMVVDSLYEENMESVEYNYVRWNILNTTTQQQYIARGTYKKEVDYITEYIYDRLAWMDNKIGLQEPIGIHSVADETEAKGGIHGREGYLLVRGFAEGSTIYVYSTNGSIVDRATVNDFEYKLQANKGIYIIKVTEPNGKTTSQKVAVN